MRTSLPWSRTRKLSLIGLILSLILAFAANYFLKWRVEHTVPTTTWDYTGNIMTSLLGYLITVAVIFFTVLYFKSVRRLAKMQKSNEVIPVRSKQYKAIKTSVFLLLIGLFTAFAYNESFENNAYHHLRAMQSTIEEVGFSKVCDEGSNGSTFLGDGDGDYAVFYTAKADIDNLDTLFVNKLGFYKNESPSSDEVASYREGVGMDKFKYSANIRKAEDINYPRECFSNGVGQQATQVTAPSGSLLLELRD